MVGKKGPTPQAGFALITSLFAVFLVAVALALMAESLQLHMRAVRDEARRVGLVALSDAALAETLAHLAESSSYRGLQERPFGDGVISSRVQSLTGDTVEIVARAHLGGRERWIRAEVELSRLGPVVQRWQRISPPG